MPQAWRYLVTARTFKSLNHIPVDQIKVEIVCAEFGKGFVKDRLDVGR
jgi:hypothetical protein